MTFKRPGQGCLPSLARVIGAPVTTQSQRTISLLVLVVSIPNHFAQSTSSDFEAEASRLTKAALYAFDMLGTKVSDGPHDKVRKWLRTTNYKNNVAPVKYSE